MRITLFLLFFTVVFTSSSCKENPIVVTEPKITFTPKEIDDVLVNPGIGFTTFQMFNGDSLNTGYDWTEGYPIEYQQFTGSLTNKDYPMTSVVYWRVYWKYLEPEEGQYNWEMIDKVLETAKERKQTLMLRITPYGLGQITNDDNDAPYWFRAKVGSRNEWLPTGVVGWRVDGNDPLYVKHFGDLVKAIAKRYDGNPLLESVDLSICGWCGEGRGSYYLTEENRKKLVDAYADNFVKTPLMAVMMDELTGKYMFAKNNIGWRADSLGDWGPDWSHMNDAYPWSLQHVEGMSSAWLRGPVSFEASWVMKNWVDNGWDIDKTIDKSLEWHISSFNAKSSAVPEQWWPQVNRWLKKMGYRFVLKSFSYPSHTKVNTTFDLASVWENKGVAPCYKDFAFALRFKSNTTNKVFVTDANIRKWMPGQYEYKTSFNIPSNLPADEYELQIGIIDRVEQKPVIQLAIEGRNTEGWYPVGKIKITK